MCLMSAAQQRTGSQTSQLVCKHDAFIHVQNMRTAGAIKHTDLLTEGNLLHEGLNFWGQVGLAGSNRSRSAQLKVSYGNAWMC